MINIENIKFDNGCEFYVESDGTVYNKRKKLLKIQQWKTGYCYVSGRDINGKQHNFLVHRLVAKAFINKELDEKFEVHHKDKNRSNNDVSNLEIMTIKNHRVEHQQIYSIQKKCKVCGKLFTPNPTKRKRAKTCSDECAHKLVIDSAVKRKIKINQYDKNTLELIYTWDSARDIQNKLGYRESNINKCCNENIKSAYGFIWKYHNDSQNEI